jgi:hypothetical protein
VGTSILMLKEKLKWWSHKSEIRMQNRGAEQLRSSEEATVMVV